jgi:hypothetical protein
MGSVTPSYLSSRPSLLSSQQAHKRPVAYAGACHNKKKKDSKLVKDIPAAQFVKPWLTLYLGSSLERAAAEMKSPCGRA